MPFPDTCPEDTVKRFLKKVSVKGENECWPWIAALNTWGYGMFSYKGTPRLAHRVAFILFGGKLSDEKDQVLHACDNPACCNPKHLFAGNQKDNIQDMLSKGRRKFIQKKGEESHNARLTKEQVREIRRLNTSCGYTYMWLSVLYHVNRGTIWNICHYKTWKEESNHEGLEM